MKVVRLNDLVTVKAEDVEPGMMLAEGIVFHVEHQVTTSKRRRDVYFFETIGATPWAYAGSDVQVYVRLDPALTKVFVVNQQAKEQA